MKLTFRMICNELGRIIKNASLYSVLITLIVCIINQIQYKDVVGFRHALPHGDYIIILLLSLVIALANLLFKIKNLPKFMSIIIHYSALLFGFIMIFAVLDSTDRLHLKNDSSKAFVWIILFTFAYAVIFLLSSLIKLCVRRFLSKNEPISKQDDVQDEYHSIL